jgi:signal transduction histidine kinase
LNIDQGLVLRSDVRRIKVVLSNLISNAIKYQDAKKETRFIQLSFKKHENHVELLAIDNGIGISEENVSRIFEMFFRATSLSTGSGLGLYIVKETIEKLGGTIEVNAALGQGTSFKMILPNIVS